MEVSGFGERSPPLLDEGVFVPEVLEESPHSIVVEEQLLVFVDVLVCVNS